MDIIIFGSIAIAIIFLLKGSREYNYKEKDHVSNYLTWGYLIEDGIIFNKNGSFQKTYKIRGKDVKSLEQEDLVYLRAKINNALKRLNGNFSIHVEARRKKATPYIKSQFFSKILSKMDNIREKKYNSGEYYESSSYLTFTWLPPVDTVKKVKDKFIIDTSIEEIKIKYLEDFKDELKEIINILKNSFNEIRPLNDEETLTFLHSCFSQNDDQKVIPMRRNICLDAYLSDTPIVDGLPPKIGDKFIGVISLLSFPQESFPAMFDEIQELGIELRWTSRYIFLNKEDSLKLGERVRGKWANKRKSAMSMVEEMITKKESEVINLDAERRSEEAAAFINNIQNDDVAAGYYTFTILVKDENLNNLEEKIATVISVVQNKGFIAIKENVGVLQAFFGSMPGDLIHNVRKVPIPTLTAIDLMAFTSIWSGDKTNKHFSSPCLFFSTYPNGSSPIYFNLHVGDVGHTAIYGKTGGGKSVLLCFLAASFKKYKDSQVFFFDKGGSARVLTTAIGGKFNDLGGEDVTFQPLANIGILEENLVVPQGKLEEIETLNISTNEKEELIEKEKEKLLKVEEARSNREKDWAFEWICEIYENENMELNPELKQGIIESLNSVATLPKDKRTLTQFQIQSQNEILRIGIEPYTKDGSFGRFFDSNKDSFTKEYSWQVFEMDKIMESITACPVMLKYIFHKLEVEMFSDGKPTLLILDECWSLLANSEFSRRIKKWLKELRKKNVSVVFATQEVQDVLNSDIKDALLNSCPSTIYLSNPRANTTNYVDIYRGLGLNNTQIEVISKLEEKRDYYLVSTKGNFEFRPDFSDFELAFIGASSTLDQKECIKIDKELTELGIDKNNWEEEFYKRWKAYKNLKEDI